MQLRIMTLRTDVQRTSQWNVIIDVILVEYDGNIVSVTQGLGV